MRLVAFGKLDDCAQSECEQEQSRQIRQFTSIPRIGPDSSFERTDLDSLFERVIKIQRAEALVPFHAGRSRQRQLHSVRSIVEDKKHTARMPSPFPKSGVCRSLEIDFCDVLDGNDRPAGILGKPVRANDSELIVGNLEIDVGTQSVDEQGNVDNGENRHQMNAFHFC